MADPEQIYQEVLQEEQGKGVTAAVAEGRAKAARARAEHGSPHPKEPKWWPGAQPHLEGNGAAPAEAPAEEAAEEPAEEPAAPEPAAEAPAPAAEAPAPAPVAEAPAPAAAPEPAPAAAAPAAAATQTQLPPEQRAAGVTHGVATGTRLRPEDEVQTETQFQGQEAVYARRKLIDEVVSTQGAGPAPTGPRSGQWVLFLVYVAIVVGAIFFVVNQDGSGGEAAPPPEEGGGGGGAAVTITAQNVAFDTETLSFPADQETELEFHNEDASSTTHNVAIYEDDSASADLFKGEVIPGGESITYQVPAMKAGTYYFQCDVHPGMSGDVEVE